MLPENYKKAIDRLAKVGRINKKIELFFNLTYKCPLRCTYCYVDYNKAEAMTQEQVDYAIEKLVLNNTLSDVKIITFFGGEPALEMDIIENTVEKWLYHPKMLTKHFSIITSFSVNQKRLLDLQKKHKRLEIVISYDVDMIKRPYANGKFFPIFEVSKKKYGIDLETLIENKNNVVVAKTITGEEKDFFGELMQLKELYDKYGIYYCLQLSKTPPIKEKFNGSMTEAWYKYLKVVLDEFITTNGSVYVPQLIHQYLKKYFLREEAGSGCGLGAEYFIDSTGTVSPCSISHHQTDLMITHEGKFLDNTERLEELETGYWNNPTCQKCEYKGFCPGGCLVYRWMEHKDYNKPNQSWCNLMEEFFFAFDKYVNELNDEQQYRLNSLISVDYSAYFDYCYSDREDMDLHERFSRVKKYESFYT